MAHVYGHSWPVRWGKIDELKLIKAYSNCPSVELFVNGTSAGVRKRNSQHFPAAGLHWMVQLKAGANKIKAIGKRNGVEVINEIDVQYQTQSWGAPAKLVMEAAGRRNKNFVVRVRVLDQNGIPCLDSRKVVRFDIAGMGRLFDNLDTSAGARKLEMYNGVAEISVELKQGEAVVSVSSDGLPTAFKTLNG